MFRCLTLSTATLLGWAAASAFGFQETSHPIETDALSEPAITVGPFCVIENVNIHTATKAEFVGSVFVNDGKIVGVGSYDGPLPSDATILDGRGKHLVPGVVDNHSHTAIEGGVNEGSLSITAEVRIADEVHPDDVAIYRALAGGVTTIRQLHGSANTIGGQDEVIKLRWGTLRNASDLVFEGAPQGIKFALGENVKRSNGGRRSSRFPATRMGVESVLSRAFARAREYQAEWQTYRAAVERGEDPCPPRQDLRLDALVGILEGTIHVHSHCYRADEILMLLRTSQRLGFQIATLQHVLEGYKVAHEMAEAGVGGSTFSDWWAYKVEAYDAIPQNAALMTEAGVLASINSDSDEMMRRLYAEAAKSVRYADMNPVEALKLVTLNSAKQLGIEDRVGSIEVGKDADLVLLDGDPLSVFTRVEWTMVDGQIEFSRWDPFGLVEAPATVAQLDEPLAEALPLTEGEATLFSGGTVHTMVGEPIENGYVLVQGDRIMAVGAGQPKLPAGLRVKQIDAKGRHVWPGMIALNSSLGLYEIGSVRATVDSSEIGENQPDVRVTAAINADSAHIPVARWTGITRAQVVPQGQGPLLGQSAVIDLDGQTWEELLMVDRDMLHIEFPGKSNRLPDGEEARKRAKDRDEAREKDMKALADLFEEARNYSRRLKVAEEGQGAQPPFDPRLDAMVPFVRGERKVGLHANNAATILAALEFAEEQKLDVVLYGAQEAWKVVDAIAQSGVAVVYGPIWSLPASDYDPFDSVFATPAVLARAGVPFAIACADPENERNLPFHAGTAAAYGLPKEEAARAVTLYAAQILGLEDKLGSLQPGRKADILVTDGHLLEITSNVRLEFLDGQLIQHNKNRQTELYERYRNRLQRFEHKAR